jgi:hypothetical protein
MLSKTTIATGVNSTTASTAIENSVSPNLPGTKAMILVEQFTNPTMTAVVEGSDDNSTFTALVTVGATNITSGATPAYSKMTEVTLPKYVRVNCSAYTDGTCDAYIINAG